jgi:hypothetical protein
MAEACARGTARSPLRDEPIDPPVERVELVDRHSFAPLMQGTSDMDHLMVVRRSGT